MLVGGFRLVALAALLISGDAFGIFNGTDVWMEYSELRVEINSVEGCNPTQCTYTAGPINAAGICSKSTKPPLPVDVGEQQCKGGCKCYIQQGKDCKLDLINGGPEFSSLVLRPDSSYDLNHVSDLSVPSFLSADKDVALVLVCPNSNFKNYPAASKIDVQCYDGDLMYNKNKVLWKDLGCKDQLKPVIRQITIPQGIWPIEMDCKAPYAKQHIVYETGISANPWIYIIVVCFDQVQLTTEWTRSIIYGSEGSWPSPGKRPTDWDAELFQSLDMDAIYTSKNQKDFFDKVLDKNKVGVDGKYFNRGHMIPWMDGFSREERLGTFYYINAVPQWNYFNGENNANWEKIESAVVSFSKQRGTDFHIYTGSAGILEEDAKGGASKFQMYLGPVKAGQPADRVPIPRDIWKVVYDKNRNDGVAFIITNDPYLTTAPNYGGKTSECNRLLWITSDVRLEFTKPDHGFTSCFTISDFKSIYPNLGLKWSNANEPSLMEKK